MFFTLTDRASTIPSNTRGCQSGSSTWSAGQEKIRGTSTKLEQEHENKDKNKKRQKERRALERESWYSASREPSDTLPGSQPCTQTHTIYNNSGLSGFQVSLSAQSTSLRESLGRSNQRGSKTPQACYSHPRCNLKLVRLFLSLAVFGRPFRSDNCMYLAL